MEELSLGELEGRSREIICGRRGRGGGRGLGMVGQRGMGVTRAVRDGRRGWMEEERSANGLRGGHGDVVRHDTWFV